MREIKFRAWDVLEEEMIKNVSVHENSLIIKIDTDTSVLTEFVPRINEQWFKVMQYTGLKDRNGKEIYEGDIVDAQGEYDIAPIKGQVYWNYGAWEVRLNRFKELDNIEVIGNIYENPELLEHGDD